MTDTRRKKIATIVLWVSVIIMIYHMVSFDYSNFDYKALFGPLSSIFLVLGMYLTIRDINKKSK
jgi:predicted membrane protein